MIKSEVKINHLHSLIHSLQWDLVCGRQCVGPLIIDSFIAVGPGVRKTVRGALIIDSFIAVGPGVR